MEVTHLELKGNILKATFQRQIDDIDAYSHKYIICNTVELQFRVKRFYNEYKVFVRFINIRDNGLEYCLDITSDTLLIPGKKLYTNDGTWHIICENNNTRAFDATATLSLVAFTSSSWTALYEDVFFADFRLRGEDGTVFAHRAVLAAASPVLLRMLAGEWKEAAEGAVDVPGTSKDTLQNLKRYIYLQELPDTGLEQLLLLAAYYIMPDLEKKCTHKLICHLTSDNAFELLQFAMTHEQTSLIGDILATIQNYKLNIDDVLKNVSNKTVET